MSKRGLMAGIVAIGLLAAANLASAAAGGAEAWTRFRGENGSGVVLTANTPASFDDKDVNWTIDLPGVGHSSPVVYGNKIFVTCGDTKTATRYLICVDLESGKTLWKKEYTSHWFRQNDYNSFASASPVVDAQRVYFTFIVPESYMVRCLDHNGNELWSYDMGRWQSQHGCGCSPILFGDLLIVPNDQDGPTASLVALDKTTGSERWRIKRKSGNTAASTPCIFQPKDAPAQLILTSSASGITSIDPRTGKRNWGLEKAMKFRSVGSPVATDSLVVGTCGEGGKNRACVVVQPGQGATPPKVLYTMPTGANYPYVPSPVIKGEDMFLWSDIGTVTCVKVATGTQVWQQSARKRGTKEEFFSSPIIAGDKLYNISKDGDLICLEAAETFKELGRTPLNDKCYATPAVAGNRLIIRTASKLISVGK
jgi:outer membrane protein assembly factor BamB